MIGIIGAGISGLTLAYELQKLGKEYILLEASERSGGYIHSVRDGNYLFELGPNSILCDADTEAFIREIVDNKTIQEPKEVSKDRYIYKNGQLQKLPSGPLSLLSSNFFSWKTKLALARESTIKAKDIPNETISAFFSRRFNKEVVDYALNPFIKGIYAGDPDQLLVEKTFPVLKEWEMKHGSVVKGLIKNKSGDRKKSLSFTDGVQCLTKALSSKVKDSFFNHEVTNISKLEKEYLLEMTSPDGYKSFTVSKVVICAPAYAARQMLKKQYSHFSESLGKVTYPGMVVVHSVYKKADVNHTLNGFGGLHPQVEGLYTEGSIWTSSVYNKRCPDDEVMFTSFVGGMLGKVKFADSEQAILMNVHKELKKVYDISADRPVLQNIYKWNKSIPQYDIHINEVHNIVKEAEKEQLYICSNWKDGVSLSDCIKKARKLAQHLSGI